MKTKLPKLPNLSPVQLDRLIKGHLPTEREIATAKRICERLEREAREAKRYVSRCDLFNASGLGEIRICCGTVVLLLTAVDTARQMTPRGTPEPVLLNIARALLLVYDSSGDGTWIRGELATRFTRNMTDRFRRTLNRYLNDWRGFCPSPEDAMDFEGEAASFDDSENLVRSDWAWCCAYALRAMVTSGARTDCDFVFDLAELYATDEERELFSAARRYHERHDLILRAEAIRETSK